MEGEKQTQDSAEDGENSSNSEKVEKTWQALEAKIREAWEETENNLW